MSILAGLDAIFDRHLDLDAIGTSPHYRHRASALRLSAARPIGFDATQLLEEAYARLVANLDRSPRFALSGPSHENWRFTKQLRNSPQNPSPEVTLERAIVTAAGPDWANQVPSASGLWDASADRRCAVDLVWRAGDRCFELVELKVQSDTPLRAAVEIVRYGLLYALARDRYPERQRASNELLQAKELHLRVLAPADYYAPYNLEWLAFDLDRGLRAFVADRFGELLVVSFGFDAFPGEFRWPCATDNLVDALQHRRRVWSGVGHVEQATG